MSSKLNEILNDLKDLGIIRADMAKDNGCSRQNITLIFKNYSKPFICYQKYLLDKAIDRKISDLNKDITCLEFAKHRINKIVDATGDEGMED